MGASELASACIGALLLVGCPLDDRSLRHEAVRYLGPGYDGSGGDNDGVTELDGEAGEGAASGAPVDSGFGTMWSFDHDEQGFEAEDGIEQNWSDRDALGHAHSGSLTVANTNVHDAGDFWLAGSKRCFPMRGDRGYLFRVDLRLASGQGPGSGGFGLEVFNAPDCQGLLLDSLSFLSANTDTWLQVEKSRPAPQGAKSALLRLLVSKVQRDPPFEVSFDNVGVTSQ
jgi:hypothetical protein